MYKRGKTDGDIDPSDHYKDLFNSRICDTIIDKESKSKREGIFEEIDPRQISLENSIP